MFGDLTAGAAIAGQRLTVGVRNFTDRADRPARVSVDDAGHSFAGSLPASFQAKPGTGGPSAAFQGV